jgi:hypothetical protein
MSAQDGRRGTRWRLSTRHDRQDRTRARRTVVEGRGRHGTVEGGGCRRGTIVKIAQEGEGCGTVGGGSRRNSTIVEIVQEDVTGAKGAQRTRKSQRAGSEGSEGGEDVEIEELKIKE